MTNIQIYYNDEPVLQVGSWRVLCPNMYGKKYRSMKNPILIHKCPKYVSPEDDKEWATLLIPERPAGMPHCARCNDPVPDEIQGLLSMYYMDSRDHVWMEAGLYENEG